MHTIKYIIFLTWGTVITGILLMGINNKYNQKYNNKLMISRLILQMLAIITMGLMALMRQ